MATYIWNGLIDGDVTNGSNWIGGQVPPATGDFTRVLIGRTYAYPDHEIYNWPTGGHLDMVIYELTVNPSHGTTDGSGAITIGSPSDYLKFDKVRVFRWGSPYTRAGGFGTNDHIPTGSAGYMHMEHWDDGPSTIMYISGFAAEGVTSPGNPNHSLYALGNPNVVQPYYTDGVDLHWGSASLDVSGNVATLGKNGPLEIKDVTFFGAGWGFTNSNITLDWQQSANGGNPVENCRLDLLGGTGIIIADSYGQGNLTEGFEGSLALAASLGGSDDNPVNTYYIRPVAGVGNESAPIVIPNLTLLGRGTSDPVGDSQYSTVCHIETGVTIGGADNLGLRAAFFDIICSPDAATPTTIKSGTLYWQTRLDASQLAPGSFIVKDDATNTGVIIDTMRGNPGGWGTYSLAQVRIAPPAYSNLRTTPTP